MNYALVTGGSKGIGRAICIKLAQQGYNLLINYRESEAAAQEVLQTVLAQGVNAELFRFDVCDAKQVDDALSNWLKNNPDKTINVLVNNAGFRQDKLMVTISQYDWDSMINANLGSFYNVTKMILPLMIKKRYGRIVNIVSLSGVKGAPGQTHYSASKAAVIGATKALAQEVASRNIMVNAVAPGFVCTDMIADIKEDDYRHTIPMRRFGKPEEVAELAVFLASPAASYLTGQIISINGGLYT